MTPYEIRAIDGEPPVLCADGVVGLLTVFPADDLLCGVQVHGEAGHRWIACEDLMAAEFGAMRQRGAPPMPNATDDLAQKIVAMEWARRGGPSTSPTFPPRTKPHGRTIKATPGQPWPDPPGGRWMRDAATGDLIEVE